MNTPISKFSVLTPRCTHFLDKLRAAQAVKIVTAFTETKGSLLFLQKSVTGRYPGPYASKTHPHTLRLQIPSIIILPPVPRSRVFSSPQVFHFNFLCTA